MLSHTHSSVHKPLNTVTNFKPALSRFLLQGPQSFCTSEIKYICSTSPPSIKFWDKDIIRGVLFDTLNSMVTLYNTAAD